MRGFTLPEGYEVEVHPIRGDRILDRSDLQSALESAVGTPPLRDLAQGRRNAVVAVEDLSRPARLRNILPLVLRELHRGGIPEERLSIIVAVGGHAPLDRPALLRKLGRRVVSRYDVTNHHPYENLVDLGTSRRGIPLHINKSFADADLKIAVGSVVPHPYAGFGGGAKIVLPGVAGIETLEANHRPAVTGVHGGFNNVEENTARREMEEMALDAGLEFIVNVVTDDRRRTLGVYPGHPVLAHRRAVEHARKAYATPRPRGRVDMAILNAYPKDTELLQVGHALNVLRFAPPIPIRDGGAVVITAACSLGRGHHSLHGPGMRLYRTPVERDYLEGRPVIFHSPNLGAHDAAVSFWKGYPWESTWGGVVRRLRELCGGRARAAVFPCAPLQLLED
jgi:nickel-dependent lactate racemase